MGTGDDVRAMLALQVDRGAVQIDRDVGRLDAEMYTAT